MNKLSVSLKDGHVERLDDRQNDGDANSRSEAVRQIIDEYAALRTECDELRTECEHLRTRVEEKEARIDELEEQLARRSQVEEKVDTLAKRVEDREQAADAPFFVRWARWFRNRNQTDASA